MITFEEIYNEQFNKHLARLKCECSEDDPYLFIMKSLQSIMEDMLQTGLGVKTFSHIIQKKYKRRMLRVVKDIKMFGGEIRYNVSKWGIEQLKLDIHVNWNLARMRDPNIHNPEMIPNEKLPEGYRFLTTKEQLKCAEDIYVRKNVYAWTRFGFDLNNPNWRGRASNITYCIKEGYYI